MNYTVILTEEAAQELEGIYHYIAHELLAPETGSTDLFRGQNLRNVAGSVQAVRR